MITSTPIPTSSSILEFTYDELIHQFKSLWGKGEFYSGEVFRQVYQRGMLNPLPEATFDKNPKLEKSVSEHFSLPIADPIQTKYDGDTYKFLLKMADGLETESVVIPMKQYKSLCVSSQIGCAMACRFCETGQMGLRRNLSVSEILAQILTARFKLGENIRNVVFMGMGEPMENLDNVLQSIRIMNDLRGLCIPQTGITVSTVGHLPGLIKLASLSHLSPPEGFSNLRLAISLNAPNDEIRSQIMPKNKLWPMAELKEVLQAMPHRHRDMKFLMEYVLIPGVNDAPEHALELCDYLKDLKAEVNVIPYNPRNHSPWEKPSIESVRQFWAILREHGQPARTRGTKGQDAMAACGQLGNRGLKIMP